MEGLCPGVAHTVAISTPVVWSTRAVSDIAATGSEDSLPSWLEADEGAVDRFHVGGGHAVLFGDLHAHGSQRSTAIGQ